MKFKLKVYNTNTSDEQLIEDLTKVGQELEKQTLTQNEYSESGKNKFHGGTIAKRLGGWNNALQKAGLKVIFRVNILTEEIIEDLRRVTKQIAPEKLTEEKYNINGKFSSTSVRHRFGSWNKALKHLGIEITIQMKISELELFKNLEIVWIKLGKQPGKREMIRPLSIFSESPYISRYGTWQKALQAFVNYINSENEQEEIIEENNSNFIIVKEDGCKHKTKRDVGNRLKVQVLMRDIKNGYIKCALCSIPLTGSDIHYDHITPYSKCGETVLENIQILCKPHNLAKGNYLDL